MHGNTWPVELHHFGNVNLFAIGCGRSVVLPEQRAPVEQIIVIPVPAHTLVWSPSSTFGEETSEFVLAGQHSARLVQNARRQRCFQHRVVGVELQQPRSINDARSPVPLIENELGIVPVAVGFVVMALYRIGRLLRP